MAMTIGVYRVNPKTQQRTTLRETHTVTGNEPLPPGSAFPRCSCAPCLDARRNQ